MLELLGQKIGMSHIFGENGISTPVTLVKIYDNCVVELKENSDKEHNNLVLAFEKTENNKKLNKAQIGYFNKNSVPLHKKVKESRIKKSAEFKTNDKIELDSILSQGDLVKVSGTSIGKGFAGAMKRHGFGGLEATHGVSISHRSHGSTGHCQDPGRVFKGKKMAGQMGNKKVTVKNLQIVNVDKDNSLIAIKGSVPGSSGSDVVVKIAKI